ncbi:hypothetical protein [Bradyrhizobium sp. SZCCHNS2015]|uniref:hypothetical protein n=1 Tax=Bradyrhizobium sp. SZCCHNS2015 TaxID=3057305 RepID=UPI0028E55341|nr:hypothetical protein [Bradyrhizobium sp. SZCCHNS2015]
MEDLAATKSELDKLMTIAAFVLDSKACARRVDELKALTAQAIEAQTAAEAAQADLAKLKIAQEAAFEERAAELFLRHQAAVEIEQAIERDRTTILRVLDEIRRLDTQMKHAVMSYGGLLDNFNARIQEMPSWEMLNKDLLGKYDSDAHFGKQKSEDGRDDLELYASETGPVVDAVASATLQQTHRTMRRLS